MVLIHQLMLRVAYYASIQRQIGWLPAWGILMLKDSLQALARHANESPDCRVGRLLQEFDEETAEAFVSAMASKASTRAIWSELRSDGIAIDRNILDRTRGCFRGTQQCACGAGGKQ
jgi:triphosphoribosyl-dephospho-CoA synthetase